MAAYAAARARRARVHAARREDAVHPRMRAVRRAVTLVDGLITDAGKMAAELGKTRGWYDVSTLKEPYRIEGKKTMGYESRSR
jgi:threonine synthase